jgi:hypothetical protein
MSDNPSHFKPGNQIGISGRWKPGQSGNPKGRPLSKPYKEALERQLAMLAMQKGLSPEQGYDMIAAAHTAKAMSGDMAAIKELADRIDGKVPNPVGGTDELPPITAFAWKPIVERTIPTLEGKTDDSSNDD